MPGSKNPIDGSKQGPKVTRPRHRPAGGIVGKSAEPTRKKNLRLHQSKIDAAMAVLGTSTETETIETALDLIVFRSELTHGVEAMHGAELVDVFGGE